MTIAPSSTPATAVIEGRLTQDEMRQTGHETIRTTRDDGGRDRQGAGRRQGGDGDEPAVHHDRHLRGEGQTVRDRQGP